MDYSLGNDRDRGKFCVNWSNFDTSERNYTKFYAVSLLLIEISQQGLRLPAGKTDFQNTDRECLSIMGECHLPLGLDSVNLQIPLFPHPHDEGKPHVQCLGNKSFGGIPAVKQQQAVGQAEFLQPLHVFDGEIALVRGVRSQLTIINGVIQWAVGKGAQRGGGVFMCVCRCV